ncbi:MAG: hypothetical protein KBS95_05880 [Alistipes sp.]|nr:hypothetical protein [Candidatus Alistipes equi]
MKRATLLIITLLIFASSFAKEVFPTTIKCGPWKSGHVQGIAVDEAHQYIYFSFTTVLVKCDLQGNVIGTVTGLLGHLGCIAINPDDGRLYGSLEYKDDVIGRGILNYAGVKEKFEDNFYIAVFDIDKIDRMNLNAEKDGIMKTIALPKVLEYYQQNVEVDKKRLEHRYGVSGIDGITFGPMFASKSDKNFLTIAFGIYDDTSRHDNDYQIIHQYDWRNWKKEYEGVLSQNNMHHNGPKQPDKEYFVYTGNTSWGVQNMEYDKELGIYFLSVYEGSKPTFENFQMFLLDRHAKAKNGKLKGIPYAEKALILPLMKRGEKDKRNKGIYGYHFKLGPTGMCALGGGLYYFAESIKNKKDKTRSSIAHLYRFVGDSTTAFEKIEK